MEEVVSCSIDTKNRLLQVDLDSNVDNNLLKVGGLQVLLGKNSKVSERKVIATFKKYIVVPLTRLMVRKIL